MFFFHQNRTRHDLPYIYIADIETYTVETISLLERDNDRQEQEGVATHRCFIYDLPTIRAFLKSDYFWKKPWKTRLAFFIGSRVDDSEMRGRKW
jgi:hypothetical protein